MPRGIYKRNPFTDQHKENIKKSKNKQYVEQPKLKERIRESMSGNQNAKGKRSEESKERMRKARVGFKPSKEHIKNMTIALNKPEVIEKNRQRAIKMWQNHSFDEDVKKRSARMQRLWKQGIFDGVFQSPTKPEKKIMKLLEKMGMEYIFQYRPQGYTRPYDFYIPNLNLLVEYDSDYWHNLDGAKERDAKKTQYARNNNYDLLRINEETLNDFQNTMEDKK